MAWRVFLAVLLVAAANVLFGLDWLSAPEAPPRSASSQQQDASALPGLDPPPVMLPTTPKPPLRESTGATPVMQDEIQAATQARAQALPQAATAPRGCNVVACEAHYKSFRVSDCTYQPNEGARKVCRRK